MIQQRKIAINAQSKEVKNMACDLQTWRALLKLLNKQIKQNQIIPYIITHVDSFIDFNKSDENNIQTCKHYYMNSLKQDNEQNNNLKNKKHSDVQPGRALKKGKENHNHNKNNNSSSLSSYVLLGTSLLLANSLFKDKN